MAGKKQSKKGTGKLLQITVKDLKAKKDARGGAAWGGCRSRPIGGGAPWGGRCSSTPFKS